MMHFIYIGKHFSFFPDFQESMNEVQLINKYFLEKLNNLLRYFCDFC